MEFIEEYEKLLIWQYQDKPKAKAHINLLLSEYKNIYDLLNSIPEAFDLDLAVGKQQDILGRILGISRNVPFVIPKRFFGFTNNPNSYGFDRRLKTTGFKIPFKRKRENLYTSGQLDDIQYRVFLKAKAIKNNVKAKMIDDEDRLSLQNAIDFLFSGTGFIIDNKDMTMTLYIDYSYDVDLLRYIKELDLLPRPQGVDIRIVKHYDDGNTFGFTNNSESKGFSRRLSSERKPSFAKKIFL
ncbi:DUF2612 domain-containing protein [Arcobacter lanthieri]|uniref:DUF2612 domain-containing protein n=1 Tax=Aliarcobacter lanthieri TaxID=1355374 RepID=UPI00192319E1|nr:DUF2612 domain-containing protein [Aliarcobacter lanthieri]MBL3520315.1 DUF2612 domain-containing protein [Aliarcobacter lanthieri]